VRGVAGEGPGDGDLADERRNGHGALRGGDLQERERALHRSGGTETEPKGNHAFYTAAFPNPYPGAKKFFVRVKSADFDGKEYFSNTVKITRKTAKRYGKEIVLDDGE
jgi:hypothetical protein